MPKEILRSNGKLRFKRITKSTNEKKAEAKLNDLFLESSAENLVLSEHDLVLAVVKHDDTSESIENGVSEDGIVPASEGIEHKN